MEDLPAARSSLYIELLSTTYISTICFFLGYGGGGGD